MEPAEFTLVADAAPEAYFERLKDNPDLITASRLKRLANPYEDRWCQMETDSKAKQDGSLIDCLWLTPQLYEKRYVIMPEDAPKRPDKRQKEAKKPSPETVHAIEWWAEFEQRAYGKTIITADDLATAKAAVDALNEHPDTREIHNVSEKQVAGYAALQFFPGGKAYPTKILMDLLPEDISAWGDSIVDLKALRSVDERIMSWAVEDFDYHVRAAHYLDTYNAIADILGYPPRRRYILAAICKTTLEIKIQEIDPIDIDGGRQVIRHRITKLEDYRRRGEPKVAVNRGVGMISRPQAARWRDINAGIIDPPPRPLKGFSAIDEFDPTNSD